MNPKLPEGVALEDSNRAQQLVNATMMGYARITQQNFGAAPCTPRALTWALLVAAAANTMEDMLGSRETFLQWAAEAYTWMRFVKEEQRPPLKETTDA